MAISVGSVEVDVVPNTRNIYARLRGPLTAAGDRAGREAGQRAGDGFSDAMSRSVSDGAAAALGQRLGRQIARQVTVQLQGAIGDGVTRGGRAARPAAARQGEDTAGAFARAARARLEAAYRSMPRLDVTLTTTGADADLARLRARMEALASRRIGVDVDADTARAQVADLEERLRRVGESHPNVAVRADTAAARAELARLRAQLDGIDGDDVRVNVRPAVRSLSTLTTAAVALGPAIVPVLGAVTAGVGALAASLTAAGAAGGVFGVVMAQQVKSLNAQRQAVDQAKAAVVDAERQVAAADTKEQRAAAAERLAAAQRELGKAQDAMSPAAKRASEAMDGLGSAWQRFLKQTQGRSLGLAARGMNVLARAVPKLRPLFDVAARAAGGLLSRLSGFVDGGGLDRLVRWLSATAGPALRDFGAVVRNIGLGVGGLVRAFAPAADRVSGALVRLTGRFREWGQSGEGPRRLMRQVRQDAPQLRDTLGNLGGALLNLASALSPLAGTGASFLNALAAGARAVPTSVLKVAGVALASIAIGSKLAAVGLALWRGAAAAAAIATRVLTGQTLALNAAQRANLIGIIVTALAALVVAVIYAWQHWDGFRKAVLAAWDWIKSASLWVWNSVLKPFFAWMGRIFKWLWVSVVKPYIGFLIAYWKRVASVAMWLWHNVLSPVFDGIGKVISLWWAGVKAYFNAAVAVFRWLARIGLWLWRNALEPVFNGILVVVRLWWAGVKTYFKAVWAVIKFWWAVVSAVFKTVVAFVRNVLGPIFGWLWRKVIKPVWKGIQATITVAWNKFIKPHFNAIRRMVGKLGDVFKWLWKNVIKPVWGYIRDKITDIWSHKIKPAFAAMRYAVGKVGEAFGKAKDAIKRSWGKLKNITKKPVNFVIRTVYTKGIKRVWDKVVGAFGGATLPDVPALARGGTLPVAPGVFNSPTAIVGEGRPQHPEYVIPTDPRYRGRALALWQAAGGQLMESGGILGGVFKGIGDIAGGAWDKVKAGASWLKDTFAGAVKSGIRSVIRPLIERIPGGGGFADLLRGGARKLVAKLIGAGERGDKLATPNIDYRPGAGVRQWSRVVLHALRLVGQPSSYLGITLRRMQQESGGNPTIVNRSDINWRLGHPSVGLMQVIGPTFRRFAGRFRGKGPFSYGTSVDPLANIYASMKYALATYGSLPRAYNKPGGYDSGGYLQPGLNLAYNGTGRPEPVLTRQQLGALTGAAAAGQSGQTGPAVFEGELRLDSGELLGYVNGVMNQRDQKLTTALRAGRR